MDIPLIYAGASPERAYILKIISLEIRRAYVFFARMIERHAYHLLRKALDRQAAVALIGPRKVGKTTLALDIAGKLDALYLNLEAGTDRAELADPALFLSPYEDRLVIVDEIHRVPEMFSELRGLIDQDRRTVRFLILESASIDLLRQSGESLAGRIECVELDPLNVLEAGSDNGFLNLLLGARRVS